MIWPMKAIILAGGKGTRLKPFTDTLPKALVPIGDSTLIERVIASLPNEVDTVIITTKYLSEKIEQRIGSEYNGKNILYAPQLTGTDGTWAALYGAKHFITKNEQFCVMNCDDLFEKEELTAVLETKKIGMGVTDATMPAKYHGIEVFEGRIMGFKRHSEIDKEEPIEDLFANGFFLLDETIFSFTPVALNDGELGLPHTLFAYLGQYPLAAHQIKYWQPCNSFEDLEKIKKTL